VCEESSYYGEIEMSLDEDDDLIHLLSDLQEMLCFFRLIGRTPPRHLPIRSTRKKRIQCPFVVVFEE